MSVYYSRFDLNTYRGTPYFESQIPEDYPIGLVLQKSRAFRSLPPNVRKLAALAKQWAALNDYKYSDIEHWYDKQGYELDPDTGQRLTDQEIDDQWNDYDPTLDKLIAFDIPSPVGGFSDPATWVPPIDWQQIRGEGPTRHDLVRDVGLRGRAITAKTWGIKESDIPADIVDPPFPDSIDENGIETYIATGELYDGPPMPWSKPTVENIYCKTGEGGGVDPGCLSGQAGSHGTNHYEDIKARLGDMTHDQMLQEFQDKLSKQSKASLAGILQGLGYAVPSTKKDMLFQLKDNLTSLLISKHQTKAIAQLGLPQAIPSADHPEAVDHLMKSLSSTDKGSNLVHLADLREKAGWSKDDFNKVIAKARKEGKITMTAAEGRHGLTDRDREAAIGEVDPVTGRADTKLLYASIRHNQ